LDHKDQPELTEPMGHKDLRVIRGRRDLPELTEPMEHKDLRETQGHKDPRDLQELMALTAHKDLRETPGHKDLLALTVLTVFKDRKVIPDRKDHKEYRVTRDLRGPQGLREILQPTLRPTCPKTQQQVRSPMLMKRLLPKQPTW
jgi:hypothetical protein